MKDLISLPVDRRLFLKGASALAAATVIGGSGAMAQATRKLVVYSTTPPAVQKRVVDGFTAKTGIAVQSLRLNTSAISQRFLVEHRSGQFACDIITNASDVFFATAKKEGFLAPLSGIKGIESLSKTWRPDDSYFTMNAGPFSIIYNTNLVTGASVPKSWEDLAKPEFAGQMVIPDPRGDDTLVPFWMLMRETYGDEFLRRVGAQKPRTVAVTAEGLELLAAGGAKVLAPGLATSLLAFREVKAPLEIVASISPTSPTYFYTGMSSHAPNKESALAWLDYMTSVEGQELLSKEVGISPLGDTIKGSYPMPARMVPADLTNVPAVKNEIFDLLGLSA